MEDAQTVGVADEGATARPGSLERLADLYYVLYIRYELLAEDFQY